MVQQIKSYSAVNRDFAGSGGTKLGGRNLISSLEAAAFLARTSGLDASHTNDYSDFIQGLVTDGIWPKMDVVQIYATQDSTTCKLNLVSTSFPATFAPTPPTFTADRGLTGVTASGAVFADIAFNPTTAPSPKYTLNSAHLSMWSRTSGQVAADGIGVNNLAVICPRYSDNNCYASINSLFGSITVANTDGSGFYTCNRSASNALQLYRNGTLFGSSATTSTTLPNTNMLTVANNFLGGAYGWGGQEAIITVGGSLSSTEAANLYSRALTWMTARGAA